jgi:hypothetical protein
MRRHPGTFAAGAIFATIGVAYLFEAWGVWTVDVARIWPVALIVIGLVIVLGSWRRPPTQSAPEPPAPVENPAP